MASASPIDDAQLARRVTWLCRLLGVGGLALLGVTWKLWTPQDVFPRVPLFAWAPPRWWDWASLAALSAGLTGLCLPVRWRRVSSTGVACGFAVQFLADQHRLQPWAWQFFILAVVIALADDRAVFRGWMILVISIYFWSALSKCDAAFLQNFGSIIQDVLTAPMVWAGMKWSPLMSGPWVTWSYIIAGLAPAIEAAIAILIVPIHTRRWGFWLSVALHLYLLMLLGPWGLGHEPGVLVWNLFFIFQNALLLHATAMPLANQLLMEDRSFFEAWRRPRSSAAGLFLWVVMLWPVLEQWGYCDAWLGWAVYVPRFHNIEIRVAPSDFWASETPLRNYCTDEVQRMKTFIGFPRRSVSIRHEPGLEYMESSERVLSLMVSRMSLEQLHAPIYPNHRFLVGVALDWQQRYHWKEMDVLVFSRKNRFSDVLEIQRVYTTPAEIEAYARTFRVNALPESVLRRRTEERSR